MGFAAEHSLFLQDDSEGVAVWIQERRKGTLCKDYDLKERHVDFVRIHGP